MDDGQHLTVWIERLRDGDSEAKEIIFRQYFEQLVRYARKRLKGLPSRERDEEDVALSVLDTFMRRIEDGQYTWVADREDLWRALYDVTAKRVAKEFRRQLAQKRGGGKVRTESVFDAQGEADTGAGGIAKIVDPRQEFADRLAETCSELFAQLRQQPKGEALVEVVQYRLANYTVQEVADKLGVSKATVERRLDLARSVCKEVLPARHAMQAITTFPLSCARSSVSTKRANDLKTLGRQVLSRRLPTMLRIGASHRGRVCSAKCCLSNCITGVRKAKSLRRSNTMRCSLKMRH